jgi:mono/diheme cytochrome c family protein
MMQVLVRAGKLSLFVVAGLFLLTAAARAQETGASLYKGKCAMCHAPDGSASTPIGKSLQIRDLRLTEVQKQTDVELAQIIAQGKGKMPAFQAQLNKGQIEKLVAYIRELGKKH